MRSHYFFDSVDLSHGSIFLDCIQVSMKYHQIVIVWDFCRFAAFGGFDFTALHAQTMMSPVERHGQIYMDRKLKSYCNHAKVTSES